MTCEVTVRIRGAGTFALLAAMWLVMGGCAMSAGDNRNGNAGTNTNVNDNTGGNTNANVNGNTNVNANTNANDNTGDDPIEAALRIDPEVDHFLGDVDVANKIIEYGSFECSHCAAFHNDVFPDIQELIDQGRVVFVFRHIAPTDRAVLSSMAAECAAQQDPEAFFPYHDLLFENFGSVTSVKRRQFATDLGLNADALEACMSAGTFYDRVVRDSDSAQILGVVGTPTFYVNGQELAGEQPIEEFVALLE